MTGVDLKSAIRIDKFNLDEECIHQPQLFLEAGESAAQKAQLRDEAKAEMDRVWAELDANIRKAAAERGEKLTSDAINNAITRHPSYQSAQQDYLKKKADADYAEVLKRAMEQRKSMLELVCRLFLAEYFSDVSVKGESTKVSRRVEVEAIKEQYKQEGRRRRMIG